jgi:two-component system, OmpR family, alkaline phosphatase synthesis response regulator PhoP
MAKKILIAEDEPHIRQLIHISLKDEGYEIYQAQNGMEAHDMALEIKPDLVLLDVMMPKMTGYEVCKSLKGNPLASGITILFLTSRTGLPARHAMEEAGGDGIFTKPFVPNELKKKVVEMLLPRKITPKSSPLVNSQI